MIKNLSGDLKAGATGCFQAGVIENCDSAAVVADQSAFLQSICSHRDSRSTAT
jgi:hypothetical protein